jgi:mono/diheme cytochrome c family protein
MLVGRRTLVHLIAVTASIVAASTTGQGQESRIWSGVYASEQAEQGKKLFESNCSTCHRSDLSGDRGPALTGDRFFTSWQAGSVNRLFAKIKETMPPNRGTGSLTEDNYLAIVAYILEANTFPPSKDDTLLTTEVIEDIIIARRGGGESKGLANFALVQVVGCLAQGPDKQWRLTYSSSPELTKDQPATAQELQADSTRPLGSDTFVLHSVARFKPETYQGQKMVAKGLIYRSPDDSLLSLTSLQVVDSKCGS